MKHPRNYERGAALGLVLSFVGLALVIVALAVLTVYMYMGYTEATTNIEGQKKLAAAEAAKDQADDDEAKFAEREKEPNRKFVGPDDYGRLTFDYPKTWSVYVANKGGESEDYSAYLNPGTVPPVETSGDETSRFATRVLIQNQAYEQVLEEYKDQVEEGNLKTSNFSANGNDGTMIKGKFDDNIRGELILLKVRDKTITVRTDANTFIPDFEKLIKTIEINK